MLIKRTQVNDGSQAADASAAHGDRHAKARACGALVRRREPSQIERGAVGNRDAGGGIGAKEPILATTNVPALIVTGPVKLLAAPSTKAPAPALVNPSVPAISVMLPPTVNLPPLTVIVRTVPPVTVEVAAPVPKFKSLGPLKVISAFQFWAGLETSVTVWPLVLPMVPPLMVSPTPKAAIIIHIQRAGIQRRPPEKLLLVEIVKARCRFSPAFPTGNGTAAANRVIAGADCSP